MIDARRDHRRASRARRGTPTRAGCRHARGGRGNVGTWQPATPEVLAAEAVAALRRRRSLLAAHGAAPRAATGSPARSVTATATCTSPTSCCSDAGPVPFDCIEFDDDFACIDVLYDLAFLVMDLIQRGLTDRAQCCSRPTATAARTTPGRRCCRCSSPSGRRSAPRSPASMRACWRARGGPRRCAAAVAPISISRNEALAAGARTAARRRRPLRHRQVQRGGGPGLGVGRHARRGRPTHRRDPQTLVRPPCDRASAGRGLYARCFGPCLSHRRRSCAGVDQGWPDRHRRRCLRQSSAEGADRGRRPAGRRAVSRGMAGGTRAGARTTCRRSDRGCLRRRRGRRSKPGAIA